MNFNFKGIQVYNPLKSIEPSVSSNFLAIWRLPKFSGTNCAQKKDIYVF